MGWRLAILYRVIWDASPSQWYVNRNLKKVSVWAKWLSGEQHSRTKAWSRRVHQERLGPMLLEGKSGERWVSAWGGGQIKHRLRGDSKDSNLTPLQEAVWEDFSKSDRRPASSCSNGPDEKQWCVDQASNKGGGKKHLALEEVFRNKKDVLVN